MSAEDAEMIRVLGEEAATQLLRAGAATERERRRRRAVRALRPVAAVAAVALVGLAVVLALPTGSGDETAVDRSAGAPLTFRVEPPGAAVAEETAELMRARLAAAGIEDTEVSVASGASLTISAPAAARADVIALAQPGRLAIYDWERSVLGATPPRAVTKAEAEVRAAERSGARVVRALPDGWFALAGEPALTSADVAGAAVAPDDSTPEPTVIVDLTAAGRTAFSELTSELARRGSEQGTDEDAFQHLAIVLDDQLLATPLIDFRMAPGGIDGAQGAQISGLTPQTASHIAAILNAGPLPAQLSESAAQPQSSG